MTTNTTNNATKSVSLAESTLNRDKVFWDTGKGRDHEGKPIKTKRDSCSWFSQAVFVVSRTELQKFFFRGQCNGHGVSP